MVVEKEKPFINLENNGISKLTPSTAK